MDVAQAFLDTSRRLVASDYLPKIEQSLALLDEGDVWWRPNDASNSIGNLILHLCGNVSQWVSGGVGGRPNTRQRQQEFDERTLIPVPELLARLRAVVQDADAVLGSLDPHALAETRQIQGYDITLFDAIYHVVEHFSMHTGQIVLLSKARLGHDLKLWRPPNGSTSE